MGPGGGGVGGTRSLKPFAMAVCLLLLLLLLLLSLLLLWLFTICTRPSEQKGDTLRNPNSRGGHRKQQECVTEGLCVWVCVCVYVCVCVCVRVNMPH